jgi:hypothetical protein
LGYEQRRSERLTGDVSAESYFFSTGDPAVNNVVRIVTLNSDGTAAAKPFHLLVFC